MFAKIDSLVQKVDFKPTERAKPIIRPGWMISLKIFAKSSQTGSGKI
jgi:hypothetical protein